MRQIYEQLWQANEKGCPAVMYTLVDVPEGAGLAAGSRLLVMESGEKYGTLGAGPLDEAMEDRASSIFQRAVAQTCIVKQSLPGGETVKILEDSYFPEKRLVIYGAGHVAQPLARMASILGYRVVVIDDRPDFASRERFPDAEEVICAEFEEVLAAGFINEKIYSSTSVVIVTRGHEHDRTCLASLIDSRARYIGMIGSKNKVRTIFKALLNEGVDKEKLKRVSAPIGLDLGGQKPAEIALSILAEMVAGENNGSGRALKEVKGGLLE